MLKKCGARRDAGYLITGYFSRTTSSPTFFHLFLRAPSQGNPTFCSCFDLLNGSFIPGGARSIEFFSFPYTSIMYKMCKRHSTLDTFVLRKIVKLVGRLLTRIWNPKEKYCRCFDICATQCDKVFNIQKEKQYSH